MHCRMRIIEAVLQTLFYDKCMVVPPMNVKRLFGTWRGTHWRNKQAAVEWCAAFLANNPSVADASRFVGKRDDMADSLLLVLYYLDTYSNQLEADGSGRLQRL